MAQYDLVVIGAGPGGEVGAIRAAQLGLKVAIVDKREHLGGTCLNVGCIPTKALLESAKTFDKLQHLEELGFDAGDVRYDWQRIQARKDKIVGQQRKGLQFLMKKNKIDVFQGTASIASPNRVEIAGPKGGTLETKNILIATGSRVKELPFAKSDGKMVLTSDDILAIEQVPTSLAVIGGGVVGMEFASLFGRFGSKVTVIELAEQVLPFEDPEAVKELVRCLKKQNVTVKTGAKLQAVEVKADHVVATIEGQKSEKFDRVLMSIGREPVLEELGLARHGVKLDGPFVKVDQNYRTTIPHIFAIGDVLATPALAHTASAEAMHAVEVIAGHNPQTIDYSTNPSAIYSYPEIASCGLTESAAKAKGLDYKVVKFPFAPLAKAKIENATEGFIKIIYGSKFRELIGVHIVGARATELIAEFSLGKLLETTLDEIGQTIHPHPTISETVMEAAHAAIGGAIHL